LSLDTQGADMAMTIPPQIIRVPPSHTPRSGHWPNIVMASTCAERKTKTTCTPRRRPKSQGGALRV
jgi:hypothetical protein